MLSLKESDAKVLKVAGINLIGLRPGNKQAKRGGKLERRLAFNLMRSSTFITEVQRCPPPTASTKAT
jgi:hypothetical protein